MWKHEKEPQQIANYLPTYIKVCYLILRSWLSGSDRFSLVEDLEAFDIGDESTMTSKFLTLERDVESFRQGIHTSISGSGTITNSSFTSNLAGIETKVQDLKNDLNRYSVALFRRVDCLLMLML